MLNEILADCSQLDVAHVSSVEPTVDTCNISHGVRQTRWHTPPHMLEARVHMIHSDRREIKLVPQVIYRDDAFMLVRSGLF